MKILLATDGSDFSKAAVDALTTIVANPENTSFKIVSTVEFPTMLASDPFIGASAEYYDEVRRKSTGMGRGFDCRRVARLRLLVACAARVGFKFGRSSRAVFGFSCANNEGCGQIRLKNLPA